MKKLFLLLFLSACATQNLPLVPGTVPISREVAMKMPQYNELGKDIEVTQLVTATYKDHSFILEGHASANKTRFLMVGLDGFGREALTINWNNEGIKYHAASFVPSQLKPENILADIVIIYWPEKSVKKALAPNAKLVTAKNQRSVYVGGKEIIHIEYKPQNGNIWNGEVDYRNLQWGYSLNIKSRAANAIH